MGERYGALKRRVGQWVSTQQAVESAWGFVKLLAIEALLIFGAVALLYVSIQMALLLDQVNAIEFSSTEAVRIAFVFGAIVYGSLFFFGYTRFVATKPMGRDVLSRELDAHYLICNKAGREPRMTMNNHRRRGRPRFARSDLTTAKTDIEAGFFWSFIFLLAAIVAYVFALSPYNYVAQLSRVLFGLSIFLLVHALYSRLYRPIQRYHQWRDFWFSYWWYLRDMCSCANRLLDQLPVWTSAISAWQQLKTRGKNDDEHVEKLFDHLKHEAVRGTSAVVPGYTDRDQKASFVDQAIWYISIREELKEVKKLIEESGSDMLEELSVIIDNLLHSPQILHHEHFAYNIRAYKKLQFLELVKAWPEVMQEAESAIIRSDSKQKEEIWQLSSERVNELGSQPYIPIPGSMKWIALLYGLVVASSQYVAPILDFLLPIP